MSTLKFSRRISAFSLAAVCLLFSTQILAATEVIEFPDNELASESVLPVFDHPEAVKQKNVPTERRIEIGIGGNYALTEPFFNPLSMGLTGTYHFNETHAVNLLGNFYLGGSSSYAEQLNPIPGSQPLENANLQYAPGPKYLFLANYQYTGFYGKISLTKDTVMNLGLYGLLGIGMIGIGDESSPVFSFGIGQKFYLTRSFAFRFDLRALAYQGPNVVSRNLSTSTSEVSASAFEKELQFGSLLSAGIIYMFPSF